MLNKIFLLSIILFINMFGSANPTADERKAWFFNTTNTTTSGEPSNLKYFKFFDAMPDEISLKVFDNIDISNLGDKKLYVGYGTVDPRGNNCKIFRKEDTGMPNDITVCLPWWRIEREYIQNNSQLSQTTDSFIKEIRQNSKPPIVVRTCKTKKSGRIYSGGKATCTTYFDRLASKSCWDNPKQSECYVNNCGSELTEKCKLISTAIGEVTTLKGAVIVNGEVTEDDTKVELSTHQYECPDGSIFQEPECTEMEQNLVFPFECKPSSVTDGVIVQGEYTYCDDTRPVYDSSNTITGFSGNCSDGRAITCQVNRYSKTSMVCKEPIYETKITSALHETEQVRNYLEQQVDVLSGEPDSYASDDTCLRVNTVKEARDNTITAKIIGNGSLDDDIYVLRHLASGEHEKIYCNMQHAGVGSSDLVNLKACLVGKGFTFLAPTETTVLNDYLSCTSSADNISSTYIKTCLETKGYTPANGKQITDQKAIDIYNCGELIKGGTATKFYNGSPMSCLRNNGSYSFNSIIPIYPTDILSVQQNSEQEINSGEPFAVGRNHYRSTNVTIDNVTVAPDTFPANHPYYPTNSGLLRTWDNTTATFSILFPFVGSYELYFYNKDNDLMATQSLDVSDFKSISYSSALQLKLGKKMKLASGIDDTAGNREDNWTEWGGGVFGAKNSTSGATVQNPNDSYVKTNAIDKVIIKDILTGAITPIQMVYPLPYPNRVFISKLKIYEKRKYRCYTNYSTLNFGSSSQFKYICGTNSKWTDYKNGIVDNLDGVQQWGSSELCNQNCRNYQVCTQLTKNISNVSRTGFTCSSKGGESIGGDIEGNFFSNQDQCNMNCFKQNTCEEYADNNCVLIGEKPTNNISDITGKTVSTKRLVSYRCDTRTDVEAGCKKYDTVITEGNLQYNTVSVGYESKDFSGKFENAMTSANMLEVGTQHIWSGWDGKCVNGKKWNFSYLSDPMTIASYAMSAYSSANWLASKGTAIADASTKASESAAQAGQSAAEAQAQVEQLINSGADSATIEAAKQQAQIAFDTANTTAKAAADAYNAMNGSNLVEFSKNWNSWQADMSQTFDSTYNATVKGLKDTATSVIGEGTETSITNSSTYQAINNTINGTKQMISDAQTSIGNLSDSVKKSLGFEVSAVGTPPDPNLSASTNLGTARDAQTSLFTGGKDMLKNMTGIDWDTSVIGNATQFVNVTQGDLVLFGIQSAFLMAAPQEADYQLADKLLQGYAGVGADSTMQAYNGCMASIGASMPNLVGWSSSSNPSAELMRPWEHPLRLTPSQLAAIAVVTSEKYVTSHYMIGNEAKNVSSEDVNSILVNVSAISADAYIKAAQTICMGTKVYQASEHMQNSDSSGKTNVFSSMMTPMAIAQLGMTIVCPPCGFAMKIVGDLSSNVMANINTCTKEEDAMQWDVHHLKTQKFLKHDQCHYVKSYCDQKSTFFGCVRTAYKYCCYDQITTKIFAEGLKEQLGKNWDSCNDININDLKDISFRECGPTENPLTNKCFPTGKYSEFQQTLFQQASKGISFDGLSQQVINSMAIETK